MTKASSPRNNIGNILIEYTEFGYNGYGDGLSHNMYINHADSFTLQYCYSHSANQGHLVKSRAKINYILYNRLSDEVGGAASYELDLPSGGPSYIIGNVFEQSLASPNNTIFSYLEEANNANNTVNVGQDLYVVNNTFVNEQSAGKFISIDPSVTVPAIVMNNIFAGAGTVVTQSNAQLSNNLAGVDPMFVDRSTYDYRLAANSPAIGAGGSPGSASSGFALSPVFEYVHAGCNVRRTNANDLGATVANNTLPPVLCSSSVSAAPEPALQVSLSSPTVLGGGILTATVNLSGKAAADQYVVSFSTSSTSASAPRTVTIPPGKSTATVNIPVAYVSAATPISLIATSVGSLSSVPFTIEPGPGNLVGMSRTSVALYNFAVSLSGPPPAAGAIVSLTSSNPSAAQAPASVTVPSTALGASFSVPVASVSTATPVTITAVYNGGTQKASFTIVSPVLAWVGAGLPSITGGTGRKGSVYLTTAAPNGGMTVDLQSSDPATLAVPTSVVVNGGSNQGFFPFTTNAVTASKTVTVSATYAGVTRTVPVIVN